MTDVTTRAGRIDVRLVISLAFMTIISLVVLSLVRFQPFGVDFLAIWAGGKASALDISRLYDFAYVSELQGWPLGEDKLRPYPYPPTLLLIFAPLSTLPWQLAYVLWLAVSYPLYAFAGRRAGVPLWFLLAPWVTFAAFCGQVTLLIGALILLGLIERRTRPILAGVLFGIAAAIKPQALIMLPIALIAEGRWRTILATGGVGLSLCLLSALIWGVQPWVDWLGSLPRFSDLMASDVRLTDNAITPSAAMRHFGFDGRWAFLLAPFAIVWLFRTFRRGADLADELIVLVGATILVSPYALHYELALFAPAVALYLVRTHERIWIGYLLAMVLQTVLIHPAFFNLLATLTLPVIRTVGRARKVGAR